LELRAKGLTQKEIAEILGTTRANVSIIERRARANIEKAKRTIEVFERLSASLQMVATSGMDLFDVPREVFSRATERGIKVREDSVSLIERIRDRVGHKLRGRKIREDIEIMVLQDGRVLIR
jgi:hypothetical protein